MIKKDNKKIKFAIIILSIFTFFSFVQISFASTEVYLNKNVDSIKSGDIFDIDLKISSSKNINVIDGTLVYDKNKLEIKNIKIDNSILSMWVKEPSFNNQNGELSFVGGVPTGFSGDNGQILKITFKAIGDGNTLIGFKDVFSVLLNDGAGTNVNPWLKPLSLSIEKRSNPYNYSWVLVLIVILFIIILLIKLKKKKNDK